MTCYFFGHRDTPDHIKYKLEKVIIDLIENYSVDQFLVGNNGNFDKIVYMILKNIKKRYPYLETSIVFAYSPTVKELLEYQDFGIIFSRPVKGTFYKGAIPIRNRWMLSNLDIVVSYVMRQGNALKFTEEAKKLSKKVINIATYL